MKHETKKILKSTVAAFALTASVTGFATLCGIIAAKCFHNLGIAIAVMLPFIAAFVTAMTLIIDRILDKKDT